MLANSCALLVADLSAALAANYGSWKCRHQGRQAVQSAAQKRVQVASFVQLRAVYLRANKMYMAWMCAVTEIGKEPLHKLFAV